MHIKLEKIKGEQLVIFGLAGILLLIVLVIIILSFRYSQSQQQTNSSITTTPSYSPPTPTTPLPTNAAESTYKDDPNDDRMFLDKLEKRKPLSNSDSVAVANILSVFPQGQTSGILNQTQDIIIDYTHTVNEFQVEILTPNLDQAKAEANVWFRAHGLSQKGICDFPVSFYLSPETATVYKGQDLRFNPLPNGCT